MKGTYSFAGGLQLNTLWGLDFSLGWTFRI